MALKFNPLTQNFDLIGTEALTTLPVFNVKKYGAKGDGTTNDRNAIQAAINDADSSGGGTVYFPKGIYIVSSGLTVVHGSTGFLGDGWQSIIHLTNSSNVYIITFTPNSGDYINGLTIKNLKFECGGDNQTAGGGIYAPGAVMCKFSNLWINKPWGNGIYFNGDNLGGFGHHNVIENCLFDSGEQSNGGDGRAIRIESSDENVIKSCTLVANGRVGAGEPNHIFDLAGLNTFTDNQFVTGQTGIKIQASHSKIVNNTFDGCQNHQVRLNGGKNIILGNDFYNIGFGSTSANFDGIWVDNVNYTTIVGNLFIPLNNTTGCRTGINLSSGPANYALVAGNTFTTEGVGTGSFASGTIILGSGTGHLIKTNVGYGVDTPTPGGSNYQVQYNNSGALAAESNFNWDYTNHRLGIGTNTPAESVHIRGGNLKVEDSGGTKAYRFRTSGGSLDLEAGGANIYLSTWSGSGFTGTQYNQMIFDAGGGNIQAARNIDVTGTVKVSADLESTTATNGVVLKAANGNRYRITVSNTGTLTSTLI